MTNPQICLEKRCSNYQSGETLLKLPIRKYAWRNDAQITNPKICLEKRCSNYQSANMSGETLLKLQIWCLFSEVVTRVWPILTSGLSSRQEGTRS
jgi:hypothetical protein